MIKCLLGLKLLPDVSTISRSLVNADEISVEKARGESRNLIIERMSAEGLSRVTLDFDGSALSTGRHAEVTAVGFNNKKKGARSYYPLFCTVAQTDQAPDVHYRPGNVHDSNGTDAFIGHCLHCVRSTLPRVKTETRIDGAFFNETIAERLHSTGVEFIISVPFERFTELKWMIAGRERWRQLSGELSFLEAQWKFLSWAAPYRFIFIRKQVRCQDKAPVQLDLFRPTEYGAFFRIMDYCDLIITNSCGIREEDPSPGKSVLILRAVTTRPEAVNAGTVG